jgi:predicted ABC-type ATPase
MAKQIHIIAGPNGAGKSSCARITLLPDFLSSQEFVNADEIAKMLSPENPEKSALASGRLMLNRLEFLLTERADFALETTLATRTYVNFIKKAQNCGYKVNLFFLSLGSSELAQQRVLNRVSKGGHSIEPEIIKRRFQRGLDNLKDYLEIVDTALIYEASGLELMEIARKHENKLTVINQNLWENLCAAMKF